ncbi:MAG: sigma-70 family RNA polymerase sigma factor, partial [Planctomycetales bacterium]|nr:sigma-70 family RNA polymerase sigma factor [Planctomycetales bacterium]
MTKDALQNLTVAQLVRAAQDGDREAFGQLASRFEGAVYAIVVRRISHTAEAQELTQEVLVQALQRLHQLRA